MTCSASRHGTATAYQVDGCRCPAAQEAQRLYRKRLRLAHHRGRAVKVDATGTVRRIRALMRIGWSSHEIMSRLGYRNAGTWLLYAETLNARTAERVAALYDELWDKPGPSKWTQTWATRQGFPPPMAWDDDTIDLVDDGPPCQTFLMENAPILNTEEELLDEVAIVRFLDGDIAWNRLTTKERLEAAVRMDRTGVPRQEIADRTHLNSRTLWDRLRAQDSSAPVRTMTDVRHPQPVALSTALSTGRVDVIPCAAEAMERTG